MTPLLTQQQRLLEEKLHILQRIQSGLAWSLARLPELDASAPDDPAIAERTAAIVDRFCKLQDQLAGAMRHAHTMLGERQRNFQDVVTWAVSEHILPNEPTWLELRSLRNRLTHEYDLANDDLPDLMALIRQDNGILIAAATRFIQLCVQRGLIRHSSTQ